MANLIDSTSEYYVGLDCCYGSIWCGTHTPLFWLCLWCSFCRGYKYGYFVCNSKCSLLIILSLILYPFMLTIFIIGLIFEFLRFCLWFLTCCYCRKRRGCTCRAKDLMGYNQKYRIVPQPPYPTEKEIFGAGKIPRRDKVMLVEEEVSCGTATAILLHGSHLCSFLNYKKCF